MHTHYQCPICGSLRAVNGIPGTDTSFRGGGQCPDCGGTFSIIGLGLKPLEDLMPAVPITDQEPAQQIGSESGLSFAADEKIFFAGEITTRQVASERMHQAGLSEDSVFLFQQRAIVASGQPDEVLAAYFGGPDEPVVFRFCSKDTPGAIQDGNGRFHLPPREGKGKSSGDGGKKEGKESGKETKTGSSKKSDLVGDSKKAAVLSEKARQASEKTGHSRAKSHAEKASSKASAATRDGGGPENNSRGLHDQAAKSHDQAAGLHEKEKGADHKDAADLHRQAQKAHVQIAKPDQADDLAPHESRKPAASSGKEVDDRAPHEKTQEASKASEKNKAREKALALDEKGHKDFPVGSRVKVQRSSGDVEDGWKVIGHGGPDKILKPGQVLVQHPNSAIHKVVTQDSLNDTKDKPTIKENGDKVAKNLLATAISHKSRGVSDTNAHAHLVNAIQDHLQVHDDDLQPHHREVIHGMASTALAGAKEYIRKRAEMSAQSPPRTWDKWVRRGLRAKWEKLVNLVTFRFCSKDAPGAIVDASGRAHLPPKGAIARAEKSEAKSARDKGQVGKVLDQHKKMDEQGKFAGAHMEQAHSTIKDMGKGAVKALLTSKEFGRKEEDLKGKDTKQMRKEASEHVARKALQVHQKANGAGSGGFDYSKVSGRDHVADLHKMYDQKGTDNSRKMSEGNINRQLDRMKYLKKGDLHNLAKRVGLSGAQDHSTGKLRQKLTEHIRKRAGDSEGFSRQSRKVWQGWKSARFARGDLKVEPGDFEVLANASTHHQMNKANLAAALTYIGSCLSHTQIKDGARQMGIAIPLGSKKKALAAIKERILGRKGSWERQGQTQGKRDQDADYKRQAAQESAPHVRGSIARARLLVEAATGKGVEEDKVTPLHVSDKIKGMRTSGEMDKDRKKLHGGDKKLEGHLTSLENSMVSGRPEFYQSDMNSRVHALIGHDTTKAHQDYESHVMKTLATPPSSRTREDMEKQRADVVAKSNRQYDTRKAKSLLTHLGAEPLGKDDTIHDVTDKIEKRMRQKVSMSGAGKVWQDWQKQAHFAANENTSGAIQSPRTGGWYVPKGQGRMGQAIKGEDKKQAIAKAKEQEKSSRAGARVKAEVGDFEVLSNVSTHHQMTEANLLAAIAHVGEQLSPAQVKSGARQMGIMIPLGSKEKAISEINKRILGTKSSFANTLARTGTGYYGDKDKAIQASLPHVRANIDRARSLVESATGKAMEKDTIVPRHVSDPLRGDRDDKMVNSDRQYLIRKGRDNLVSQKHNDALTNLERLATSTGRLSGATLEKAKQAIHDLVGHDAAAAKESLVKAYEVRDPALRVRAIDNAKKELDQFDRYGAKKLASHLGADQVTDKSSLKDVETSILARLQRDKK